MNTKKFTKWLIGAFALTMAVFQPVGTLPDNSPLNTVVTAEAASTQPGKVTLRGITAVSNNRIRISWNKASNATYYRIYYKVPGGRWKLIKTVGSNVTSYTHVSSAKYPIKCGQKYTYTVRAYNSKSRRAGSYNAKGLTTRTVPSTVALRSARRNSNNSVTVSWNKAYGGNYYRVYRKTPGSGWKLLANVRSTSLSYTDRNPVKGKTNIYTVRMYNSATRAAGRYNTSGVSVNIGGTASAKTPGKPTLSKISSSAYNKITISWKKASNATHYRIYYKAPGGRWKLIKTVGANTTSYTHTSSSTYPITCGQNYTYTVRGYNSSSKKAGSYNSKGLTTKTLPSTVSLRYAKRSGNTVTVSWNKAYGGNYYRVYRRTAGTSWKLLANVKSSSLSYTDKNPVKGQKNIYTVRMYNSSTKAAGRYNTNGVSVTVPNAAATVKTPGKPVLTKIATSGYNKVIINWNKTSNATHYRIYYKTYGASSWHLIATVGSGTTSYTHTSSSKYPLVQGRKYTYTVRAYNSTYKTLGSYDSNGLTVTIPKQQHQHSYQAIVTTEPTCTTNGVKTYTCTGCGDTYTEAIPATGEHHWQYEGTDVPMSWQDENGVQVSNEVRVTSVTCCTICGYFYGNQVTNSDLVFDRYWLHTDEPGPCYGRGYTVLPVYARYELYECPDCQTFKRGKLAYYHYRLDDRFDHTLTQEEIDELGLPQPEL